MKISTAALIKFSLLTAVTAMAGTATILTKPSYGIQIHFDEPVAGLAGGGKITDQYYQDYGITFSTPENHAKKNFGLVLYDTNCKKGNANAANNQFSASCTGGDEDLATGRGKYGRHEYDTEAQGNVLIIQENGDYSDPDDTKTNAKTNLANGDRVSVSSVFIDFATADTNSNRFYENGITLKTFEFLDLDEEVLSGKKLEFNFEYLDGSTFTIDNNNYSDYIVQQILSEDWDGNKLRGDNSLRKYSFQNDDGTFDSIKQVHVS
ncbi:hypothetical protein [Roseofilum casamattae]|uniref:Uncharacterized protein n=1 Tax=Roseofilum casamattae BLCC-M143 TaxID=3022442 RepID=A0ABT7C369_9CYAN|nr:hypothetical protein [Roseofilum casamattae]MDJ1185908.1 hypothetical protein [Roseofilum casamattae BLCC-M143]